MKRFQPDPCIQLREMAYLHELASSTAIKLEEAWKVHVSLPASRGIRPGWNEYVRVIYVYCKLPLKFNGE